MMGMGFDEGVTGDLHLGRGKREAYRADDLARLVNDGDRLAERRHR